MAESSLGQPCIPAPRHELGKCAALLALILYPGLLLQVPGRAGRVCALTPPRMKDYCAKQRNRAGFSPLSCLPPDVHSEFCKHISQLQLSSLPKGGRDHIAT